MAKEEDVKNIELKVSVNCCDGCRKKVMKALNIKGVLKTDVHPTLPKVTVVGNVEAQTLIKKLAKCGKTAELWPAESKKQDKEEEKSHSSVSIIGGNEKAKDAGDSTKKSGCSEPEKNPKSEDKIKANQNDHCCSGDGDKGERKAHKEEENTGSDVVKNINPNCATATLPTKVTSLPQVNYMVNPSMAQDPGNMTQPFAPRVFFTMEPSAVPMAYYSANSYAAPPPPCCIQDHHYYSSPTVYHCRPPPPPPPQHVASLPSQFGDYFNDENTVGCNVM